MFKVGEYYENDAKSVAAYLRDAGFKVDIKGLVLARTEYSASLQGKLSETKGKIKNPEQCEQYLAGLKAAMEKGADSETFRDLFLEEIVSGWRDKLVKFEQSNVSPDDLDEQARDDLTRTIAKCIVAMDFAHSVLDLNDIEFDKPSQDLLDDPIISVPVNPDDYEFEDPMIHQRMDVELEKKYEIMIEEFSTPLFAEIDKEFLEKFPDEFLTIRALGYLIENLIETAEKGKIDIEEFADGCMVDVGNKDVISVDGNLVAEEIARSLEKFGKLKMKGNTIKWKI